MRVGGSGDVSIQEGHISWLEDYPGNWRLEMKCCWRWFAPRQRIMGLGQLAIFIAIRARHNKHQSGLMGCEKKVPVKHPSQALQYKPKYDVWRLVSKPRVSRCPSLGICYSAWRKDRCCLQKMCLSDAKPEASSVDCLMPLGTLLLMPAHPPGCGVCGE